MNSSQMGKTHNILLIERDASVQDLLSEVLIEADYQVLTHGFPLDPAEVPNLQPDLIILDVPTLSSSPELDYVNHLKTGAHTAHVPILALCKTCPSTEDPAWTHTHGISGYLRKPFDLDDFLDAIQSAIAGVHIAALVARHDSSAQHADAETALQQA